MDAINYPTNGENKMTPEMKAVFEKSLNDPTIPNKTIVVLFNSMNSGDNLATTNPELYALFAKAFMNRNIDLRDYIVESINTNTGKTVQLTKPQLKRIIREEKAKLVNEASHLSDEAIDRVNSLAQTMFAAYNNISAAMDDAEEVLPDKLIVDLEDVLDTLENVSERLSVKKGIPYNENY